jgi:hypothetical protein
MRGRLILAGAAVLAALGWSMPAPAQVMSSGGSSGGIRSSSGGLSGGLGTSGGLSSGLGTSGGLGSSGGLGGSSSGSLGNSSFTSANLGLQQGTAVSAIRSVTGSSTSSSAVGGTSFLGAHYAIPQGYGISGGSTRQQTFGNALYNITTNTNLGRTGGVGGFGGAGGFGGGFGGATGTVSVGVTAPMSFTSVGMQRTPTYTTVLDFNYQPPAVAQRVGEVQRVLAVSDRLPSRGNIRVSYVNGLWLLQGEVADERERRLAEGMVRLTPGVTEVRNELSIRAANP